MGVAGLDPDKIAPTVGLNSKVNTHRYSIRPLLKNSTDFLSTTSWQSGH